MMTPTHSDVFADSIGICLHPEANPYRNVWTTLTTNLKAIGIRHARVGAGVIPSAIKTLSTAEYLGRINWIAQMGIKLSVVMQQIQTDYNQIDQHFIQAGGNWFCVEASNEPNAGGGNWGPNVASYQQALYNAVKNSALLQQYGVAVAGPGLTGTGTGTHACGDLSPYVDYGNWHPYNNGLAPEHFVMDYYITDAQAVYGTKPLLATEFGLTTSLGQTRINAVSDDIAVCYLPRQFLTNFEKGFVRSYWHQAVQSNTPNNLDSQAGYGLIAIDGTLTPKWQILRTLITKFADPGAAYTPTDVDVTVSGGDTDLKYHLFQKRDGTNQLALWLKTPIWDNVNYKVLPVAPQSITITLPAGKTTAHALNFGALDNQAHRTGVLNPAAGTLYTANASNQITMNIGPDVTLVEF